MIVVYRIIVISQGKKTQFLLALQFKAKYSHDFY